ncbi:MAG: hypothetical protein LBK47_10730 [Prevotellaceae bacterium]|jgi:hypothetical protein|nr:hypothetical protein [Prevotellaceae bacterium]
MNAIIYKEWIKTRRFVLLLGVLFAALITYIFLWSGQMMEASGAVIIWETIIGKDMRLVGYIKYLPPAAGILLAIVQFAPEMQSKRLKLTLHLPVNEGKMMCGMLGYGFTVLLALFSLSCAILMLGLSVRYAHEIVMANFWVSLPWFAGGLFTYLLGSWTCLEPVWKQRIFNAVTAACLVATLYTDQMSGAYATYLPYMLALLAVCFFFSLYSTARFKDGVQ